MTVTGETAKSLADKLVEFRSGISEEEGAALDALLNTFKSSAAAAARSSDFAALSGKLAETRTLDPNSPDFATPTITPTTTTITITTTVASHPVITCD